MKSRMILLFGALVLFVSASRLKAETPAKSFDNAVLKKALRPQHPRLMMTAEDFARVKQIARTDPLAATWEKLLLAEAEKMLKSKPVAHVLIGPRLLDKSRTALQRVSTLAALYQLTGDKRFSERAKEELLTVAAFADWNPHHFLDVAEMTTAVAIGYDWLFDELSPDQKSTLRHAIVEMGLKPGLKIYEKDTGWARFAHNWNQVCNGGMTVGALAIADEEPELAEKIIAFGRASIPRAMANFAPDGGWAEGPGYWSYATQYNVFYLAALETALGTDFGLKKMPGFPECGDFRMINVGPSGLAFNYADAGSGGGRCPQMFWLARTFNRPDYDAFERQKVDTEPGIFSLLWFNPRFDDNSHALDHLPPSKFFKGIDVAILRSDWQDANAFYVGFKGGDNRANHAHLDLGTFVMDALGQRWAIDLGSDEYNMPGYFGKQRWTYYRLKTEGHNTITLDGENQNVFAKAPITEFGDAAGHPFAVADLSEGYQARKARVFRGIAITGRKQVLVQDEIDAPQPVAITWSMHTNAAVKLDGASAVLSQGNAQLQATILSPEGATFEVAEVNLAPPQHPTKNTRKLLIHLPAGTKSARIVVVFTPFGAEPLERKIVPLIEWKTSEGSNAH